jgi:sensor domain CHASE-containing protein
MAMFSMQYLHGHVMVYDKNGKFLFSADNEREALEELQPNKVITDMKELIDLLMENHEWADENC